MEQQVTDISNSNMFLTNIINTTEITITYVYPIKNLSQHKISYVTHGT
jgi:hypothetical protein